MNIDKYNDRALKDAKRLGRETFSRMVYDYWPACTRCGQPLKNTSRSAVSGPLERICACPNAKWVTSYSEHGGWERREDVEA